jgi:hypothetical protein
LVTAPSPGAISSSELTPHSDKNWNETCPCIGFFWREANCSLGNLVWVTTAHYWVVCHACCCRDSLFVSHQLYPSRLLPESENVIRFIKPGDRGPWIWMKNNRQILHVKV